MSEDKKPDHLKLVTSSSPEDIFNDVEALRKVAEHKVQRRTVAVNMSVRKPPDNAYFQCHHDPTQRIDASLLFDKEEQDIYFVAPPMMNHPLVVSRLRRVTLATTYLWPSGQILLWPVPFPTGKGSVKCWKTARRAFEIASGLATDLDPPARAAEAEREAAILEAVRDALKGVQQSPDCGQARSGRGVARLDRRE
jgi:hypothetical protein